MEYQDSASALNRKVAALIPSWGNLPIWERDEEVNQPSIVHMTYSAILAVIGNAEIEWVALDIEEQFDRAKTAFVITTWTAALAVQAVREPGKPRPIVTVSPRAALTGLDVLKAPLLTTTDYSFHDASVALRLTYPAFSAELRDKRGDDLLAALPTFVAELSA